MSIIQYRNGVPMLGKKQRGHTTPKAPLISLDQPGRLRVANLLALLGISHTTLYAGLKTGRYPRPEYDRKVPYWRTEIVKAYLGAKASVPAPSPGMSRVSHPSA